MNLLITLIFSFIFTNFANAAESSSDSNPSPAKHPALNQSPDLSLSVVDDEKQQQIFFVHAHALRKSAYFDFRLKTMDLSLNNQLVFHSNSAILIRKIINFVYGHDMKIADFEEFYDMLRLQEQLQFEGKLNDKISDYITVDRLQKLSPSELSQIFKATYHSSSEAGKQCRAKIIDYICTHRKLNKNCSPKNLAKHLNGPLLRRIEWERESRDNVVIQTMIEEEKFQNTEKEREKVEILSQNIFKKITRKSNSVGTVIPVSKSIKTTHDVMKILQSRHQIVSELLEEKGSHDKFKIKIIR